MQRKVQFYLIKKSVKIVFLNTIFLIKIVNFLPCITNFSFWSCISIRTTLDDKKILEWYFFTLYNNSFPLSLSAFPCILAKFAEFIFCQFFGLLNPNLSWKISFPKNSSSKPIFNSASFVLHQISSI